MLDSTNLDFKSFGSWPIGWILESVNLEKLKFSFAIIKDVFGKYVKIEDKVQELSPYLASFIIADQENVKIKDRLLNRILP